MYERWDRDYCRAYSDGHNHRALRGHRLDHYAHAYADICEERRITMPLASFFHLWDAGEYWGVVGEHWRCAE